MLFQHPDLAEDWLTVLEEFEEQADDIISSTISTWWGRGAGFLHGLINSRSGAYQAELKGLAAYLGVSKSTLMAGQLVYDSSTVGGIEATCGCTSMAMLYNGEPWHGRLLDWNWPQSISGRMRHIRVRTRSGMDFTAEHIPGVTGFTGAYNSRLAANLNQAPVSGLRVTQLPALWWFRNCMETGAFARSTPPPGGMTDALIHVTRRNGTTSRIYYVDGEPDVYSEKLTNTPVVLTNTYDREDIEEDEDCYEWCRWREDAILKSRKKNPLSRLKTAKCEDTVHEWEVTL